MATRGLVDFTQKAQEKNVSNETICTRVHRLRFSAKDMSWIYNLIAKILVLGFMRTVTIPNLVLQ
jgi:hypothetical protein